MAAVAGVLETCMGERKSEREGGSARVPFGGDGWGFL
jgi:hypothetical protein